MEKDKVDIILKKFKEVTKEFKEEEEDLLESLQKIKKTQELHTQKLKDIENKLL